MRLYPMASVGVRRGLPKAGGRETPFGLLPALASPCRTRRSNPGAPKLTMSQEVLAMFAPLCLGLRRRARAVARILSLDIAF
jgi:hypothetical protein